MAWACAPHHGPRRQHMAWLIGAEAAAAQQLPRFCPPAPSGAHQSGCLCRALPPSAGGSLPPCFFFVPSRAPFPALSLQLARLACYRHRERGDGEIALIGVSPLFAEILVWCSFIFAVLFSPLFPLSLSLSGLFNSFGAARGTSARILVAGDSLFE